MEENNEFYNEDTVKKENITKYGEFVCTQFAWLPLDKQKENAERFDKITKKKSNK